jgi:type II secretory ATPase GspE/PulE/Tfp pilus assembly ATPase PilB-like protein
MELDEELRAHHARRGCSKITASARRARHAQSSRGRLDESPRGTTTAEEVMRVTQEF